MDTHGGHLQKVSQESVQVTQPQPEWQQWSRFGGSDETEVTWESTVRGRVEGEKAVVQDASQDTWATYTTSQQTGKIQGGVDLSGER